MQPLPTLTPTTSTRRPSLKTTTVDPRPPIDPRRTESSAAPKPAELDELVQEYSVVIYRLALSIVRDPMTAEDVVQETLIKAWLGQAQFRGESSRKSWVLRIAHNSAISILRKKRDVVVDPVDIPDEGVAESVESRAQQKAVLGDFAAALDKLDELSRAIVVMRELEHLSYDDIATTLDVPLSTVKTRLLRARRTLSDALEGWKS